MKKLGQKNRGTQTNPIFCIMAISINVKEHYFQGISEAESSNNTNNENKNPKRKAQRHTKQDLSSAKAQTHDHPATTKAKVISVDYPVERCGD